MLLRQKISYVARLQGELLRKHQIGHPDWYAEMLVCAALDGKLALTNNPDYDLVCSTLGKVQVKSRVDGTDTTQNRTNFKRYSSNAFDHAAIVIFESDYRIKGAVVIPIADVLSVMRKAGHVKWQDAKEHKNSVSITSELKHISREEA
ncbi:hypothetical protein [Endozoicomonas euniceicola]|uniref:PD(D/E)XK endonuclease domain-containing protein n=1 Tax=Endozoicomonas euniceicola TaxID=1234143 RepID=A0ABY6GVW3_9GAMM|nr:hypothetical protein [Endozoicomonas euniceicola]UYM16216.1 hypothetical protein NX720_26040 [Endozoicomonas euniceicola]